MLLKIGKRINEIYSEHQLRELSKIVPEITEVSRYHFFVVRGHELILSHESDALNKCLEVDHHPSQINDNEIVVMPRVGLSSDLSIKISQWIKDFELRSIHSVDIGVLLRLSIKRTTPLTLLELHQVVHLLEDLSNQQYFISFDRLEYSFEQVKIPKLKYFKLDKDAWMIEKQLENYGYNSFFPELTQSILHSTKPKDKITGLEVSTLAWYLKNHYEKTFYEQFKQFMTLDKKDYFFGVPKKLCIQYIDPATKQYNKDTSNGSWLYTQISFSDKYQYSRLMASKHSACSSIEKLVSTVKGVRPGFISPSVLIDNLSILDYERPWEEVSHNGSYKKILKISRGVSEYASSIGVPVISGGISIVDCKKIGMKLKQPLVQVGVGGRVLSQNNDQRQVKEGDKIILIGSQSIARIPLEHLPGSFLDNKKAYSSILPFTNPELQRRVQCLLNRCSELKDKNPVVDILQTQGIGLSSAMYEFIQRNQLGVTIYLNKLPGSHPGIDPNDLWCHENYDRYIVIVDGNVMQDFIDFAERENCTYFIIGNVVKEKRLIVENEKFNKRYVDLPLQLDVMKINHAAKKNMEKININNNSIEFMDHIKDWVKDLLQHMNVGDKSFLIHQMDSTVGGLVAQDAFVGSGQVAVSDYSVMMNHFEGSSGVAFAVGESVLSSACDPKISAIHAIHESITNLLGIGWQKPSCRISISFMAYEDNALTKISQEVVNTIEKECLDLGVDLKIMDASLINHRNHNQIKNPMVIARANVEVPDVENRVSPVIRESFSEQLYWINLSPSPGLGGSVFYTTRDVGSNDLPLASFSKDIKGLILLMHELHKQNEIGAYHDVSSGGLITTIIEMFIASVGKESLDSLYITWPDKMDWQYLFSEGRGCVLQVKNESVFQSLIEKYQLKDRVFPLIKAAKNSHYMQEQKLTLNIKDEMHVWSYRELITQWSSPSYLLQKVMIGDLMSQQSKMNAMRSPYFGLGYQTIDYPRRERQKVDEYSPKVAIIREQGCCGYYELAEAFHQAGFITVDVHMKDIQEGRAHLDDFNVVAVCGGASFDDAVAPGLLWSTKILEMSKVKKQFKSLLEREEAIVLAIGNGAQMMMRVHHALIGDTEWPSPELNMSGQFENRYAQVMIEHTPSPWLEGMHGYHLAIPIACRYGRLMYKKEGHLKSWDNLSMRFINDQGSYAHQYPVNPTGSDYQAVAVSSKNMRLLCILAHPERAFLRRQYNWSPKEWSEYSPWFQLFCNAYDFTQK